MKADCPHKFLKKQLSGMQVWYVCVGLLDDDNVSLVDGCGQKFKVEAWDGKVRVILPKPSGVADEALAQLRSKIEGGGTK